MSEDTGESDGDDGNPGSTRRGVLAMLGGSGLLSAGLLGLSLGGPNDALVPDAVEYALPVSRVEWVAPTGGPMRAAPAVADGTVYAGAGATLRAFDAATGAERWSAETGARVWTTPAVGGDAVYLGTTDGTACAFDRADGRRRWASGAGETVESVALADDGRTVCVGDRAGTVRGLDPATGDRRWAVVADGAVTAPLAVADGTVYAGSADGHLYALDAADGTDRWTRRTRGQVQSLATADGVVYAGSADGHLYALDAADGTEQWAFDAGRPRRVELSAAGDAVYVEVVNDVQQLDARGFELWTDSYGDLSGSADGLAYVVLGTVSQELVALSASDGRERWSFDAKRSLLSDVAAADGRVYVGTYENGYDSRENYLYALDAGDADGADAVDRELTADLTASPSTPMVGEPVRFAAGVSTAPAGGSVAGYEWAFGADAAFTETGVTATRTFERPGETVVRLRVTDAGGRTDTASRSVAVTPRPDGPRQFQRDPGNTGHAPAETGPTGPVSKRWEFRTPDPVWAPPAVVDGVVYAGCRDGYLYAVAASDGSERWSVEVGGPVASAPAVAGDTVYACGEGTVAAVDAATGEREWAFETDGPVRSSPVVADDTVYVPEGETLRAVDAADGTDRWSAARDGALSSPAVADGSVFAWSDADGLFAVDATDGAEQWSAQASGGRSVSPTVRDGTVYVGGPAGEGSRVTARDAADGTEQWSRRQPEDMAVVETVVTGDTVYATSGQSGLRRRPFVVALDAETGDRRWGVDSDGRDYELSYPRESPPVVAGGTVYLGDRRGTAVALDAETGDRRWEFGVESPVTSPAVADGTVYVGTHGETGGRVLAITDRAE